MTERTLLLRHAQEGRYVMVGTDFPSARVFDTSTSRLACVVELPPRSRGSLAALSLTSVALGTPTPTDTVHTHAVNTKGARGKLNEGGCVAHADVADSTYAAVGLSNGTVLVHDIVKDTHVGHVAVSDTQHAVISMAMRGGFLFCLTANSTMYVVSIARMTGADGGPPVVLKTRTQPDASAIAVWRHSNTDPTASSSQKVTASQAFHVLVAGPTHALLRVQLMGRGEGGANSAAVATTATGHIKQNVAERLLAFSSQGTGVDYAWLGTANTGSEVSVMAAVTASADEGVIRIWDMSTDTSGSGNATAVAGRCRRTLLCGQRTANISVLDLSRNSGTSGNGGAVYILATTFTGTVLVWNLGGQLLPRTAEAVPLPPAAAFFSMTPSARMLYAVLVESGSSVFTHLSSSSPAPTSSTFPDASLSLLLMRGKLAMPTFEVASAQGLLDAQETRLNATAATAVGDTVAVTVPTTTRAKQQRRIRKAASALGLGISPSLLLIEVAPPATTAIGSNGEANGIYASLTGGDDATPVCESMGTIWANQRYRLAAKALMTPSEAFAAAHAQRAASMKELPVSQLTLEQRLRALSEEVSRQAGRRRIAASAAGGGGGNDDQGGSEEEREEEEDAEHRAATGVFPSLGLATVPLYQALHANDVSAVMELLSIAARSADGMRATVLALQLPYALQLIQIISERLGVTSAKASVGGPSAGSTEVAVVMGGGGGGLAAISSRSPLLLWLDTLLHYRGMEMYQAQLEASEATNNSDNTSIKNEAEKLAESDAASLPKAFLAPVLHQYQRVCANYDKIASLHGRLSIFNAVRPSEKNQFVNRPRKMLSSNRELASATPAALSGKLNTAHVVQDNDILFPAMFTELRTKAGPHVVRVRSKLALEKQRRRLATTDRALLKKAKRMAKEAARRSGKRKGEHDDSDADVTDDAAMAAALGGRGGEDEDVDLETLEALGLGSSDDDDDEDDHDDHHDISDGESGSEEGEDGSTLTSSSKPPSETGKGRRHAKKARRDQTRTATDEMLADAPSSLESSGNDDEDEDIDAELDSSDAGADFDKESDDDVHSQVLELSDEEGGSSNGSSDEDDEESELSADEAGDYSRNYTRDDDDDDDDDDNDDDDGMGEEMAHMLKQMDSNDEDAKRETRKSKRVRTD